MKVNQTKIKNEKDYQKWNWEVILELFEGQLITGLRLESLYKTKFVKRLLKFYLPDHNAFTNLPWK